MVHNTRSLVRTGSDGPTRLIISNSHDCRVLLLGFEPGQALETDTSSSTVVLEVLEGSGRFVIDGRETAVGVGDLAVCPPNAPHGIAAGPQGKLSVLVVIAPQP